MPDQAFTPADQPTAYAAPDQGGAFDKSSQPMGMSTAVDTEMRRTMTPAQLKAAQDDAAASEESARYEAEQVARRQRQ